MFKENGGQISGSIYSIYWCVSGVISVIYETIRPERGADETTRRIQA